MVISEKDKILIKNLYET